MNFFIALTISLLLFFTFERKKKKIESYSSPKKTKKLIKLYVR